MRPVASSSSATCSSGRSTPTSTCSCRSRPARSRCNIRSDHAVRRIRRADRCGRWPPRVQRPAQAAARRLQVPAAVGRDRRGRAATSDLITLFDAFGELIDAAGGLLEFSDLLKRPLDAYKYLQLSVETGEVALQHQNVQLNCAMIGSANEVHL